MRRPRSPRLAMMLVIAAAGGATAGVATADRGDDPPAPPRKPLAAAALGSLTAPAPAGIVADVRVTNRVLPAMGPLAGLAGESTGTLRVARTGEFKLALTSEAGDFELTGDDRGLRLYDDRTDTIARVPLPAGATGVSDTATQVLQRMLGTLTETFAVSDPEPGSVAGRPAYTVRITPRDDGGLLGAGELSWDAAAPVPLRFAVHARAQEEPVLELALTRVAYEDVALADVAPARHPGAERLELPAADAPADGGGAKSGLAAVRAAVPFDIAAPRTLAGLPRRAVRLVKTGAGRAAIVVYGSGLGTVIVTQSRTPAHDPAPAAGEGLVEVNIDGATGVELANPLGTMLQVRRGGVTEVVAGFVPPTVAERAARELR